MLLFQHVRFANVKQALLSKYIHEHLMNFSQVPCRDTIGSYLGIEDVPQPTRS
jgi:hypothetical protein